MAVAVSWFKSASLPPGPVKGSLNITPKNAWGCLLKDKSEDNDPKDGWKSPKEWWQKESWRVLDGNPVEMQWGDLKCLKRSSVGKLLHGRESKYFSQSLSETIIGNISTKLFLPKGSWSWVCSHSPPQDENDISVLCFCSVTSPFYLHRKFQLTLSINVHICLKNKMLFVSCRNNLNINSHFVSCTCGLYVNTKVCVRFSHYKWWTSKVILQDTIYLKKKEEEKSWWFSWIFASFEILKSSTLSTFVFRTGTSLLMSCSISWSPGCRSTWRTVCTTLFSP